MNKQENRGKCKNIGRFCQTLRHSYLVLFCQLLKMRSYILRERERSQAVTKAGADETHWFACWGRSPQASTQAHSLLWHPAPSPLIREPLRGVLFHSLEFVLFLSLIIWSQGFSIGSCPGSCWKCKLSLNQEEPKYIRKPRPVCVEGLAGTTGFYVRT